MPRQSLRISLMTATATAAQFVLFQYHDLTQRRVFHPAPSTCLPGSSSMRILLPFQLRASLPPWIISVETLPSAPQFRTPLPPRPELYLWASPLGSSAHGLPVSLAPARHHGIPPFSPFPNLDSWSNPKRRTAESRLVPKKLCGT